MHAKYEKRTYVGSEHVWVGKYRNLHNISHWHLEHEIITCYQGHSQVMINDRLFELNAGECAFCPSGSVHYINSEENAILLVCIFDEKLVLGITSANRLASPIFADKYNVVGRLSEMLETLSSRPPFFAESTEAQTILLVTDLFRGEPLSSADFKVSASTTRYKQLLNTIDRDYEFISFSDAAKFMNFSEAYFSSYFKHQSGMTFTQYLNIVKIEKAVGLLASEHNIKMTDVMSRCGFNTIRSFNRTFKEITGYSPKQIPTGYALNTRSVQTVQDTFNPTLNVSILL